MNLGTGVQLWQKRQRFKLALNLNNLLDKQYVTLPMRPFPMAGRSVVVSLNVSF
jgi:outer membrane receptor protein involved in Fe transport